MDVPGQAEPCPHSPLSGVLEFTAPPVQSTETNSVPQLASASYTDTRTHTPSLVSRHKVLIKCVCAQAYSEAHNHADSLTLAGHPVLK